MRKDIAARTLEAGPAESGVFAARTPAGHQIELLDADGGRRARRSARAPGWSPRPATREQRPTWIITGTDDVGVAAAAAALTEDMLRYRFALAIEDGPRRRAPAADAVA